MQVGIIGGGQMAQAIIAGAINSGQFQAAEIWVSDPDARRLQFLKDTYGINGCADNKSTMECAQVIILAVKPQVVAGVLREIYQAVQHKQLIISLAAGITIKYLEDNLPSGTPVVRVMPNTPCLIGQGISVYALGAEVNEAEQAVTAKLLEALGESLCLPEAMMNAVTAISGSGPAYVYLFIEALIDAGVRIGLPRDIAKQLTLQTVLGATKMVAESGQHPAELRNAVTSPGGTTIAAIQAFEQSGFRASIFQAVMAAESRATELSNDTR